MIPGLALVFVVTLVGIGVIVGAAPGPDDVGLVLGIVAAWLVVVMLISFLMTFVLIPLTLLVALTEDLGAALSPAFVKDFIRRMWGPILKVELFMMFSGTLVIELNHPAVKEKAVMFNGYVR